jgi:hypothetical protein
MQRRTQNERKSPTEETGPVQHEGGHGKYFFKAVVFHRDGSSCLAAVCCLPAGHIVSRNLAGNSSFGIGAETPVTTQCGHKTGQRNV